MKSIQNFKAKTLNVQKLNSVKGGDMARETTINRTKSASKIHNS